MDPTATHHLCLHSSVEARGSLLLRPKNLGTQEIFTLSFATHKHTDKMSLIHFCCLISTINSPANVPHVVLRAFIKDENGFIMIKKNTELKCVIMVIFWMM